MPIRFEEVNGGKLLVLHATGKLTKADYEPLAPELEELVRRHGKISLLFDTIDFHGWDANAAWEDFKLAMEHFADIERVAIVGDRKWQRAMVAFCKLFAKATVRYYDHADAAAARLWLSEV